MTIELVVFSGLQAAGKTTFYRQRFVSKLVQPSSTEKFDRRFEVRLTLDGFVVTDVSE